MTAPRHRHYKMARRLAKRAGRVWTAIRQEEREVWFRLAELDDLWSSRQPSPD